MEMRWVRKRDGSITSEVLIRLGGGEGGTLRPKMSWKRRYKCESESEIVRDQSLLATWLIYLAVLCKVLERPKPHPGCGL